jgi:hypothetical protein
MEVPVIVHLARESSNKERLRLVAELTFVALCSEVLFSTPYRSIFLLKHSRLAATIVACAFLVFIGMCCIRRKSIFQKIGWVTARLPESSTLWLTFWLAFGLLTRLGWVLCFPTSLKSDNYAYFQLAREFAEGSVFVGTFSPPGFSLALAPFIFVFGAHQWVSQLFAFSIFVATYTCAFALARKFCQPAIAALAPALISVWPGYLTLAGINCKESFLAFLVSVSLLLYVKASNISQNTPFGNPHSFLWYPLVGSGLIAGLAALTQPGFLLFPVVVFVAELIQRSGFLKAAYRATAFSVALLVAVAPWTLRNYIVTHRFVLISTNGGSVFYRANNPLANANYSLAGEVGLPSDSVEADRAGYKLGISWITHHPASFVILGIKKQIVFLGDDSVGAYETLKRDLDPPVLLYASAKAVCNLFWLILWSLLVLCVSALFGLKNWTAWFGMLFLPMLYQWGIDCVFESGPRHHIPYIVPLSVLLCCAVDAVDRRIRRAADVRNFDKIERRGSAEFHPDADKGAKNCRQQIESFVVDRTAPDIQASWSVERQRK